MDMSQAIKSNDEKATSAAWKRYVALMDLESPSPAEVKEMRSAMAALGKSPADLDADRRLFSRARDLRATIRAGAGLDADREAAQKAVTDSLADMEQVIRQRREQHHRLVLAASDLTQRYLRAQQAEHELAGLTREHPELAHATTTE
jgi:hypothetical protein